MSRKVVVIGLDGATLDVVLPLVDKGALPNLAKIMQNGVYGKLGSTVQPITPQAWTSFLTGKNAGKHGIFDFTRRKPDSYDIEFVNASRRKAQSIFSILSETGKKVGAVAIPFTFPPEAVNGFMLSGMDAPGEDHRTVYPSPLYAEIKQKFGNYHIHLASPVGRRLDQERFWRDIEAEDQNRALISSYLLHEYPCDLFMTVFNNTDRVAHQHLDESVCERIQAGLVDAEDMLVKTYVNTDAKLEAILSEVGKDDCVLVMSDHGSGPIKRVFFLNRWLEENGWLTRTEKKRPLPLRALYCMRFMAKRFFPRKAKNLIESKMGGLRDKVESMLSFSGIEWGRTKAYGFGLYGNICINLKGREPDGIVEPGEEYERVCGDIIRRLTALTDPDTGEKIIDRVYRREALYNGPYLQEAPDLIIRWKDYSYYTSVSVAGEGKSLFGPHMNIDSSEYKHVGSHRLDGVFMAKGSIIKEGAQVSDAQICDVAPTILHILGQPVPQEMDGKVLTDIFKEDFIRDNPPCYGENQNGWAIADTVAYSDEEGRMVAERLKGLGYLE